MNAFKALGLPGQLIVTVVAMGLIVLGGWKLWPNITEQRLTIKKKDSQLKDLETEVAKGRNLEKQLPALEHDIANREKQLEHLKGVIPPFRTDSEIIQKFEFLAKRSRLDITKVVSQKLRKKEFYDEYPLKLNLTGNYHDIAKFFERMARLPRIFNVSGVKLVANKAKGRTTASIRADFTAVTFIYREGGQAAPAKKKAPKKKKPAGDSDKLE